MCGPENGDHFVKSPVHELDSIHATESLHGTQDYQE